MKTKITARQIEESTTIDQVVVKKGIYTARRGYFYGMCESGSTFAEKVKKEMKAAFEVEIKVVDCGNHYTEFNGGAALNKQSHYWVKFAL